ncbi:MAG: hypothetical protein J6Y02_07455 [Pseudobutyrivibrio sp.]|nr:hypothetical protein [Pseudobutyrivibrio sp.]
MAKPTRSDLQHRLEEVLGSKNVYFKAPESGKMAYPCFKYDLAKIDTVKASDKIYKKDNCYTLIYIDRNPDNTIKDSIFDEFDYIAFDRSYKSDNLYHYVYTLYF